MREVKLSNGETVNVRGLRRSEIKSLSQYGIGYMRCEVYHLKGEDQDKAIDAVLATQFKEGELKWKILICSKHSTPSARKPGHRGKRKKTRLGLVRAIRPHPKRVLPNMRRDRNTAGPGRAVLLVCVDDIRHAIAAGQSGGPGFVAARQHAVARGWLCADRAGLLRRQGHCAGSGHSVDRRTVAQDAGPGAIRKDAGGKRK